MEVLLTYPVSVKMKLIGTFRNPGTNLSLTAILCFMEKLSRCKFRFSLSLLFEELLYLIILLTQSTLSVKSYKIFGMF